jgi:PHD/YefM family antitoxin component YafN of YafNO toxin-antitoxin module
MQKPLSELLSLPEAEVRQLVEHEPLLVTHNGEPHLVAQSLNSFESMVRRLRELEAASTRQSTRRLAKIIPLRSIDGPSR